MDLRDQIDVQLTRSISKNKFISKQIAAKFQSAQRIGRKKAKNYKKQKSRRNCFVRQENKKFIFDEYQQCCGISKEIQYRYCTIDYEYFPFIDDYYPQGRYPRYLW